MRALMIALLMTLSLPALAQNENVHMDISGRWALKMPVDPDFKSDPADPHKRDIGLGVCVENQKACHKARDEWLGKHPKHQAWCRPAMGCRTTEEMKR